MELFTERLHINIIPIHIQNSETLRFKFTQLTYQLSLAISSFFTYFCGAEVSYLILCIMLFIYIIHMVCIQKLRIY